MSTQRYIDTSFWDDAWVQELDPSEKLLYIYLLTNPLTNIAGVMELTVKRMSFDTGFNADTINHILAKFEKAKKVYKFDNYIIIRNFPKHQQIENDKILKGIAAILSKLPDNVLAYLEKIGYELNIRETFDSLSIPYTYPTNNLKEFNLNLNLNLNESTDTPKKNPKEKHKYGTYTNVLLTEDEYSKLSTLLTEEKALAVINNFSELKEMKGYKYKSDYLAIKKWGITAYEENHKRKPDQRDMQEVASNILRQQENMQIDIDKNTEIPF